MLSEQLFKVFQNFPWQSGPQKDVSLAPFTSFRCKAKADLGLVLQTEGELVQFLSIVKKEKTPWLILGRGSNTLFTDRGIQGVVCWLKGNFQTINFNTKGQLQVGAGVLNRVLSLRLKNLELKGGEFLSTIPGSVGGSLVMNAGAFGQEIKDSILSVRACNLEGEIKNFPHALCQFSYRSSVFQKEPFVLCSGDFFFEKGEKKEIEALEKLYQQKRKSTQPTLAATWGSVFKNPKEADGKSAGALIEGCGLKGKGFGQVKISEKHANFFENLGDANFSDIQQTILLAQSAVREKFGVQLELEVKIYDSHAHRIDFQ